MCKSILMPDPTPSWRPYKSQPPFVKGGWGDFERSSLKGRGKARHCIREASTVFQISRLPIGNGAREIEEAKGKRAKCKGLADVLGKTKADEVVPEAGVVPVPER